jgi:hypothetical protein
MVNRVEREIQLDCRMVHLRFNVKSDFSVRQLFLWDRFCNTLCYHALPRTSGQQLGRRYRSPERSLGRGPLEEVFFRLGTF